jgi:hypothetical protein
MEQAEKFDAWGIVEVMGHKQYAGRITEQVIAGSALVRIDVPEVLLSPERQVTGYCKLVGVASIYCITPTTEEIARKAARRLAEIGADPLPVYLPVERQLGAGVPSQPGEEFEWDEREDEA